MSSERPETIIDKICIHGNPKGDCRLCDYMVALAEHRTGGGAEVVKEAEESAGVTISGEAVGIIQRLRAELDEAERVLREIANRFPGYTLEEVDTAFWAVQEAARAYFAARRERAEKE